MAIETRKHDLIPGPPIQTKVYPILAMAGFLIVVSALAVMAVVATVASGVFDNPKTVRDAAEAGSSLLARQGDLATFPLWVQPLKFLGLTLLVTAIFTVFWGVLSSLRVRGSAMVESIPALVKGQGHTSDTDTESV